MRLTLATSLVFATLALAAPASADPPVEALVEAPRSNRAALFTEELARLEAAVVTWLEARADLRVTLLPADTRQRLSAPLCAEPMSESDVLRERLGRVAQVSVLASCHRGPPCELRVRISRPPVGAGAFEQIHEWRAPVASGRGDISAWLGAVAALAPPPPSIGVGRMLGTLGQSEAHPSVEVDWVAGAGPFRTAPSPAELSEPIQSELDQCFVDGWPYSTTDHAVLAFARDGSASRCELTIRRKSENDEARSECLCRALSNARVAPGRSGRRLELGITNHTSSGVLAGEHRHHARFQMSSMTGGFRAYPGFDRMRQPVARCFAMAGVTVLTRVPLRVFVNGSGALTRAEIEGTNLGPEVARCLQGIFRPMAFTCPVGHADATWEGTLVSYTEPR